MKFLSRRYELPGSARQILGISGALAILLGASSWGVNAANLSGPSNRAAQEGVRDARERTQKAIRPPEAWRTEGRAERLRPKQSKTPTTAERPKAWPLHRRSGFSAPAAGRLPGLINGG
jgi:hypothetical protein